MNKKYIIGGIVVIIILIATIILALGALPKSNSVTPGKMKVTASFYPLAFFTQQIAGDKADVTNITPSGAEPHDYEPTPKDIIDIADSKLLILLGPGLEAWGNNIKQNLDPKNTRIITVGEGIINQTVVEDGQNVTDPHIWLSPPLAKQIADKIALALAQIDPANKDYYNANAEGLKAKLDELDKEYTAELQSCKQKNIVTSHAAFGYLATAYALSQVPIAGLSPDAEPSSQQLADVAKFVKKNNIKYIFFESLVSPKLSDTIATETGAKTLELNPIEGLTPDQIKNGESYVTVMEQNLTNLKIALECK
jgi:zinc transport system substrate-binding protein